MIDNSPAIETDNIFAELDLPNPNPDELKHRVYLGHVIREEIARRGLSQREAAEIMGTQQSHVSAIVNNRFKNISLERLIQFCERLGLRVAITVEAPAPGGKG